jgi:hypothetical protein
VHSNDLYSFQAVEDVNKIVLHANVDSIHNVTLTRSNGTQVPIESYNTEARYHFLNIYLNDSLVTNETYVLSISYSSTMNDGPMMRGVWKGWYKDENNVER